MIIELTDRDGCPLCGSWSRTVHIDFPEIPVNRCAECNFMFSSKLMPDDALKRYYTEGFGSLRHLQGQMVNATINVWALRRLLGHLFGSVHNLLDVGTGYGFFLKELRDGSGIDVKGVELSRQEARYGKEKLHLDIRNTLLSESDIKKDHFDIVTSFEVIEHIPDPRSFISQLTEYAKPGGHLLIMTDNFESKVVKALGPGFPKWIPHSHISHFGPTTFERVVSEAGMVITRRLSYTPWELILRRYYYQLRGIKTNPADGFNLSKTLETEMGGVFRLFQMRRMLNKTWAQLQAQESLEGAIMYLLAGRVG